MIDERLSLFPNGDGPEWFGTIKLEDDSEAELLVSVARVDPPTNEYIRGLKERAPNFDRRWIDGLLGLQRRCSLIRPEWKTFDPSGAAGGGIIRQKQEATYTGQYFVDGACSDFLESPCVTEAVIESYALETLLASETLSLDGDLDPGSIFDNEFISGVRVVCFLSEVTSSSTQVQTRIRKPMIKLIFKEPQNALNVINAGYFLQNALSLVCGMKFKPLPLKLGGLQNGTRVSCDVHISGQHWMLDRYWLDGMSSLDVVGVEQLVVKLLSYMPDLSDDVIVYLDQLREGTSAEDIIFWAMPVLERNLHRHFETAEETSYIEEEQAFWEFVDSSESDAVRQFARKHLRIVEAKRPSAKMLLQRAITVFEDEGVIFPDRAAAKIWRARTKLMHGAATALSSSELGEAADLTRTLGILILLKKMGLSGGAYAEGVNVISAFCSTSHTNV